MNPVDRLKDCLFALGLKGAAGALDQVLDSLEKTKLPYADFLGSRSAAGTVSQGPDSPDASAFPQEARRLRLQLPASLGEGRSGRSRR